MKKILISLVFLIILLLSFSIGFYSGTHYDFTLTHWSTRVLQRSVANAVEATHVLKLLEKSDITEAKNYLNLKLDGHLLEIHQLIDVSKDNETKDNARRIQLQINELRATYKKSAHN